jgi:hypothetical protein
MRFDDLVCPRFVRCLSATALPGLAALLMLSSSVSAQSEPTVLVEELQEGNWDRLVPQGKEVDAIYGDYVMQNSRIRAVIARPVPTRNANMTVRNIGGCLIDLTTRDFESDQLSAFYPGRRSRALVPDVSTATSSATVDGTTATTSALILKAAPYESTELEIKWFLADDRPYIDVESKWTNISAADVTLTLEDDLRADGGKEIMPKTPNGTVDLFWFQDVYWQQAYGVHAPGFRIRCNSNARESVLVYERVDGQPVVVKPGESFTLLRRIYVHRHLPGVLADFEEQTNPDNKLTPVQLTVVSHGRPGNGAFVAIQCDSQNRGTVRTDEYGRASMRLPQGACEATVTFAGQNLGTFPLSAPSDVALNVDTFTPGLASIVVTDQTGQAIPAKVEFRGSGETPTPDWGPETAEHFVKNLAYSENGKVIAPLQSGDYDVMISHGPEHNAEFTRLRIEHGKTAELKVVLPRVVSTPGWVSADFHSHSSPSGDNTGSQLGRVLNLAAEHIEFAPCTEHNRISTYEQHIERLGLKPFLATVSGMELTGQPLPINHQNVFPLIFRPRTQDGGAPVTDISPETQMERIAAWDNNSVKLIQQNHPDIGWLFYDRDGDQKPDEGYSRSFGLMNVMEIHPIDPLLNPTPLEIRDGKPIGNQTALNWLQLLNQGFRIYGVVNTDSHYNFHGSGGLRLWVRSTTDDPAAINSDEMRDMARSGQVIMSNGPYLEASFTETGVKGPTVISGQDLHAKSGKVTASIRVQCPNWFDVDTVFVLVNGRRHDDLTFSRDTHPDLFTKETIRFEKSVELTLQEDAHLVVVTGHRTELIGDIMGPMWGRQHPTAVSNPVYVDLQGDGFKANKDTLDTPLPVKFVAPK